MGAPGFAAGGAFSLSLGGLFGVVLLLRPSAGMCPRRGTFFSCVAKKRTQKKATPLSASLRFASGNLRCSRPAGSRSNSLRFTALKQSRALIRWPLRSLAHTEGMGSQHPLGSSLRSARSAQRVALASARWGRAQRRSVRLFGCWVVHPLLAAPAAGWSRGGMGVAAPMLRELTRRGCSNGAPQARSEFRGAPCNRLDAGLPRSEAQGAQAGGRPFFGDFLSAKRKKVAAPPGPLPGSRPMQRHAVPSANKPRLRQAQPKRLGTAVRTQKTVRSNAMHSIASSVYRISARGQNPLKTQRPIP